MANKQDHSDEVLWVYPPRDESETWWCRQYGNIDIPEGWEPLPPGDAFVTRQVKLMGLHWVAKKPAKGYTMTLGIWAPKENITAAQKLAEETKAQREAKRVISQAQRERQEMVRKNLEKQIDEAIRIELEDMLHDHVKNWCKPIRIHQENVSLVGQMVGLPIGAKRVDCRFFAGIIAMTVRQAATAFIEANCYECPHHEVVSLDNFGRAVISEMRKRKQDRDEIDEAKLSLEGLIPSNPAEVLVHDVESDVTARELAGLLTSGEHKQQAADRLLQAARHRPGTITHSLASVLIGAFLDTEIGSQVMEVMRLAGAHDEYICPTIVTSIATFPDYYSGSKLLDKRRNSTLFSISSKTGTLERKATGVSCEV